MAVVGSGAGAPNAALLGKTGRDPGGERMATPATGRSRPGLSVGPTSEFSLFFRVKPGEGESLRAALRELQETPGYRPGDDGIAIKTINEARFVLFDDDTRLAFVTSFDGPWDAYMEDFFTSAATSRSSMSSSACGGLRRPSGPGCGESVQSSARSRRRRPTQGTTAARSRRSGKPSA
jgi:hypothetical protein